ncbi:MAG: response regulator [Cyanobacteria bacterium P01_C01_bin.89]
MAFSKRKLKILIVDDCVVTRTLLGRLLEPYYVIATVAGAMDALKLVEGGENIDLFLLDVAMPEMDGLEFCRVLRKSPKYRQVPVVVLTSRTKPFDRVQGAIAGATAYLTKPIQPSLVLETLNRYLSPTATS